MSIKFNVNNSIKEAKDIFIAGSGNVMNRVVKVLTSINDEKKIIYQYVRPTVLHGYYFSYTSSGSNKSRYQTTDFTTFTEYTTGTSVTVNPSTVFTDGRNVYFYYCSVNAQLNSYCQTTCFKIDDEGNAHNYECSFTNPAGGTLPAVGSAGYLTDIFMLNGKFYYFSFLTTGTSSTSNKYLYVYESDNGIDWTVYQILSFNCSYFTNLTVTREIYTHPYNNKHYVLFALNGGGSVRDIIIYACLEDRTSNTLEIGGSFLSYTGNYFPFISKFSDNDDRMLMGVWSSDNSYTSTSYKYIIPDSTNIFTLSSSFINVDDVPCPLISERIGDKLYGFYQNGYFYNTTKNQLNVTLKSYVRVTDGFDIFTPSASVKRYNINNAGIITSLGSPSKYPASGEIKGMIRKSCVFLP